MKHTHLYTLFTALAFAAASILHADVVVLYDGDNNSYTSADQTLSGSGIGGFTTLLSTSGSYTGPTVYGGTEVSGTTLSGTNFRVDDNNSNTSASDALFWNAGGPGQIYGTFLFDASQTFQLDDTSSFRLNARRTGGRNFTAGEADDPTGIRWVLREEGTGNYYISEMNQSNEAQYSNAYDPNWGASTVAETAPETLSWFNYTPGSGINTGIGAAAALDFNSASFDQGGFFYSNGRNVGGSLIMEFAQFEINAIPEPSTFALVGLTGLAALFAVRRRRR